MYDLNSKSHGPFPIISAGLVAVESRSAKSPAPTNRRNEYATGRWRGCSRLGRARTGHRLPQPLPSLNGVIIFRSSHNSCGKSGGATRVKRDILQTQKMKCALCGKPIADFSVELHRLDLDEARSADICGLCIDRFLKWQQRRIARLFPTAAIKRRTQR